MKNWEIENKKPMKTKIDNCYGCINLKIRPNQGNFFDPTTLDCAKRVFKGNSWTSSPWEGGDCEFKDQLPDNECLGEIMEKLKEHYGHIEKGDFVRFTSDRYLYIFDRIEVIEEKITKVFAWVKDERGNISCIGLGVEFPNMYKI